MQNPYRNRPQEDVGRDDRENGRWEARERRRDESPSWTEGDGGRTAEAWRGQGQPGPYDRHTAGARDYGYGGDQQGRHGQGMAAGWSGDRASSRYEQDYRGGPSAYAGSGWGSGRPAGQGEGPGGAMSRGDRGDAFGADYRGASGPAPDHGYAPGSQIWQGSGGGMGGQTHQHHDFEPDYLHWREQQLSAFDKDYAEWRSERREKFSSDFDSWRSSRPRVQADNPIVGDVSDGGTGNAAEIKKR